MTGRWCALSQKGAGTVTCFKFMYKQIHKIGSIQNSGRCLLANLLFVRTMINNAQGNEKENSSFWVFYRVLPLVFTEFDLKAQNNWFSCYCGDPKITKIITAMALKNFKLFRKLCSFIDISIMRVFKVLVAIVNHFLN